MSPDLPFPPFVLIIIYVWSLVAKGIALWRAAALGQRNWFVAILVLSTLGILELVYLIRFAKKPLTLSEIKSWFPKSAS